MKRTVTCPHCSGFIEYQVEHDRQAFNCPYCAAELMPWKMVKRKSWLARIDYGRVGQFLLDAFFKYYRFILFALIGAALVNLAIVGVRYAVNNAEEAKSVAYGVGALFGLLLVVMWTLFPVTVYLQLRQIIKLLKERGGKK